jgi:hypothetical protein
VHLFFTGNWFFSVPSAIYIVGNPGNGI